jgi:hypothetical protein
MSITGADGAAASTAASGAAAPGNPHSAVLLMLATAVDPASCRTPKQPPKDP